MPLEVNGTTIADGGEIYLNGHKPTVIEVNGVRVWDSAGAGWVRVSQNWIDGSPNGTPTVRQIDANTFEFTPLPGTTHVNVCTMGGGGGGSRRSTSSNWAGGGWAGEINHQIDYAVDGTPLTIITGNGGLGGDFWENDDGGTGESTQFNDIVATGGAGGISVDNNFNGYYGQGAARYICNMTTYDGLLAPGTFAYGGQAGLGNGGMGMSSLDDGQAGTFGSGGGATDNTSDSSPAIGGKGGNGTVMISWS